MSKTFLYFAYGSNMLTKRIHINNPTAVKKYVGTLKDYRLDFITFSKRWQGCAATIVPCPAFEVWGIVWEINISNMPDLDKQEGVHMNLYFAKNVIINTTIGENIECRVYQQLCLPEEYLKPIFLPPERQPSFIYLNTLIRGAKEHKINKDYIKYLESFHHNGYNGEIEIQGIFD
ncbi:PREDICTED: gamma-glutamylcyclotransferase-like [Ceratosolen solmsi marchali]|uniref:gamma-glutamylcyclotransferase n=1 Tax=Ceratosolen solmsi marchali TaxID=326594 RepID=A0AAJ7DUI3_9HYME|nr:PREDICTED: gamma-glutamylcyclotransferase-like [Ceratosolen solmsi marchali]